MSRPSVILTSYLLPEASMYALVNFNVIIYPEDGTHSILYRWPEKGLRPIAAAGAAAVPIIKQEKIKKKKKKKTLADSVRLSHHQAPPPLRCCSSFLFNHFIYFGPVGGWLLTINS